LPGSAAAEERMPGSAPAEGVLGSAPAEERMPSSEPAEGDLPEGGENVCYAPLLCPECGEVDSHRTGCPRGGPSEVS